MYSHMNVMAVNRTSCQILRSSLLIMYTITVGEVFVWHRKLQREHAHFVDTISCDFRSLRNTNDGTTSHSSLTEFFVVKLGS